MTPLCDLKLDKFNVCKVLQLDFAVLAILGVFWDLKPQHVLPTEISHHVGRRRYPTHHPLRYPRSQIVLLGNYFFQRKKGFCWQTFLCWQSFFLLAIFFFCWQSCCHGKSSNLLVLSGASGIRMRRSHLFTKVIVHFLWFFPERYRKFLHKFKSYLELSDTCQNQANSV